MTILLMIALAVGILLGVLLIIFTLINKTKLPSWCTISFVVVGVLIVVACIMMATGIYTSDLV